MGQLHSRSAEVLRLAPRRRDRRRGQSPEAELGYRLRRSAWGRGLGTEGCVALIRYAFTELNVRRIRAETMAVNVASRRVMEKAGLRYVRTFHLTEQDPVEGAEHGEVEYELRREDWLSDGQARAAALRAR